MKTDVFKKWVALLGGVMMLANVVLPWLTYAEDPGTPAPVPAETAETLKEKFAKAVEEQMATIIMPAGTEKSYDAETKTVTITVSESAKALTKDDIKWTNWIVALNTILNQENVKTFKMGSQDERDVKQIKNTDSSLANLKFIILADAGNEIIAQWAPNLKNLGQFIGKTLKVAVSYGTDTISVDDSFSFKFVEKEVEFEKKGDQHFFFTKDEAVAYFKTLVWEEKANAWGDLLSTTNPVIALVYEVKNAGEKKEIALTSDVKARPEWLEWAKKPENQKNNNDSADEEWNLVMKASYDADKINGYHAFFLSPGDQIDADFSEGNFTLTVGEKVLTYNVKKVADLEWKTDYDPSKSTNSDIRNFWTARPGKPFVDIKNKDNAKLSNLLGFVYQINNAHLAGGNNVGYTITKWDKVIAYGAYHGEGVWLNVFQWSFRDWSTSAAYTAEATKYDKENFYHDGPGGSELDDVEGINGTILKAGEKVTILIKAKLANGKEATLTWDYEITQQDVINATIGEKVTLTLMDGDKEIGKQAVLSGTVAQKPADPKKEKNTFKGWFTDKELTKAFDFATKLDKDTTLYAKWEAVKPSSSGSSSGGGGGGSSYTPSKKTTTNTAQTTTPKTSDTPKAEDNKSLEALTKEFVEANKADTQKVEALAKALTSVKNSSVAQELKDAYTYAYLRGITTQPSIEKAELQRGLTRAEMAKMMSVFAMKVFGKKAVKTDTVQYADVKMEGDLPGFIQLAYQLQIMGIDAKGNALPSFNPNAEVTRAEFATVLSRVLYGDTYNTEGADWAAKHLEALKSAGILKSTQSDLKELRGWVMLMLQRAEGVK